MNKKNRVVFIIQGEGRGHMTQAIALAQILKGSNYVLEACLLGMSNDKGIPPILKDSIACPIIPFDSPNLIYSKKTGSLKIRRTVFNGLCHIGRYFNSLNKIHKIVKHNNADLIVNFYDVLGGLYNLCINQNSKPFIPIAHQYYLMHSTFEHPKGKRFSKFLVNLNSRLTAAAAPIKLALSFRHIEHSEKDKIYIVPPLLRKELIQLKEDSVDGNFILAYSTVQSTIDKIEGFKIRYPEFEIHCFSPKPQNKAVEVGDSGVFFHKINSEKYLMLMSRCQMVITTAGFESVCEAFFLGKNCILMPVSNHYEQECNAVDAVNAGAGIMASDINDLFLSTESDLIEKEKFQTWVGSANSTFIKIFDNCMVQKKSIKPIRDSSYTILKYSLLPLRYGLSLIYHY